LFVREQDKQQWNDEAIDLPVDGEKLGEKTRHTLETSLGVSF